ncbi:MAG: HypC/HybG/HupF family hydrogenase formation chaperone [Candidatus Methanomethylicia archaeon]
MCVAYPGRVIEIRGDFAKVDFGAGTIRDNIIISVVNAKVGDYVLVHAGYAIQVIDEFEARQTIEMWEEMTKDLSEDQKKRDFYEVIGRGE